jgi:hypothetical protein
MNVIEAAQRYATEWEWPVFFVTASKQPFAGSHGYLDASLDPTEIESMWRPDARIALAVPEGYAVVDLDPGADPLALHLPCTLEQHTPRGGRHLVYATDRIVRPTRGIRPFVDLRGPGSYILAEPSPGYWWVNQSAIAPAPRWVYERVPLVWQPIQRGALEIEGTPTVVRRRTVKGRLTIRLSVF